MSSWGRAASGGEFERMKTLNIFEVIEKTTHRIEPFHSEFLAAALRISAEGDRSLFETVWRRAAPQAWFAPLEPEIVTEDLMDDGRRIDICIFDKSRNRVLGIEVKTTKASAKKGQLEDYLGGLAKRYKLCIDDENRLAISYLTPFNRERAREVADHLATVTIFEEFRKRHKNARHISWLDIADIPWDGNVLWQQHQTYVRQKISNNEQLENIMPRDRALDRFFAADAIKNFWIELPFIGNFDGKTGLVVDLGDHKDDYSRLVSAFELLIEDTEAVVREAKRQDRVSEGLTERFLGSEYGPSHRALFDLARRYDHVWLAGERDYGLRVAHKAHSGGVSLVRSKGERYLQIGQSR